jgi:predicted nucleic acid-binding protein
LICIDTYGWLERFVNGPLSSQYNSVIDRVAPMEIITSVVTLYEVYRKLRPMRGEAAALEDVARLRATRIVPVDDLIALEAADYSLKFGLHFSDALIYATARHFHADLHTSDSEMKGKPGVVFH